MVFKFNPLRLLTRRLIAACIALAQAVFSCFFIYVYCLVLFGTLDKSNPPQWITCAEMSVGTCQWILILCIVAVVYELVISIILFVGTIKKVASVCNVWIDLSPHVDTFWFILSCLLWVKYNIWAAAVISAPFSVSIWMHILGACIVRPLVKELENLDLSRSSNMAGLLARVQQGLLQLHVPLPIHAA